MKVTIQTADGEPEIVECDRIEFYAEEAVLMADGEEIGLAKVADIVSIA